MFHSLNRIQESIVYKAKKKNSSYCLMQDALARKKISRAANSIGKFIISVPVDSHNPGDY